MQDERSLRMAEHMSISPTTGKGALFFLGTGAAVFVAIVLFQKFFPNVASKYSSTTTI
jgi:hypothetical protein